MTMYKAEVQPGDPNGFFPEDDPRRIGYEFRAVSIRGARMGASRWANRAARGAWEEDKFGQHCRGLNDGSVLILTEAEDYHYDD